MTDYVITTAGQFYVDAMTLKKLARTLKSNPEGARALRQIAARLEAAAFYVAGAEARSTCGTPIDVQA
jgi:hypothetical protein